MLAAGAGLSAVEALDRGEADAAFCAVRPPGHHASPHRPMGFCLVNNIGVTAAALAERGERVLIVDWDAHHGNGTQDAFYDDARVLFISMHQYPFYPGTGALTDTGCGAGEGVTVNVPFPAGTSGDTYRAAIEEVVVPAAERFEPTWVLVSAGFDGHRADPLTDLGLSAGDYVDLTARVVSAGAARAAHRLPRGRLRPRRARPARPPPAWAPWPARSCGPSGHVRRRWAAASIEQVPQLHHLAKG